MENIAKKIWAGVKIAAVVLAGLFVAALGVVGAVWMKRIIQGSLQPVREPQNWWPVKNDPSMITVDAGGEIIRVDLSRLKDKDGKSVTSDKVTAVGVPYKGSEYAQVEIKHEVVDRRGVSRGVASNAINGGD
ncbi:MAG: hypothetical protein IMZ71_03850 [Chloroflexi bacterium]|nr:hypothetical protein [Chloroflexota bacterium]